MSRDICDCRGAVRLASRGFRSGLLSASYNATKMYLTRNGRSVPVEKLLEKNQSAKSLEFRHEVALVVVVEIEGTCCFCKLHVWDGLNSHAPPPNQSLHLESSRLAAWSLRDLGRFATAHLFTSEDSRPGLTPCSKERYFKHWEKLRSFKYLDLWAILREKGGEGRGPKSYAKKFFFRI